jgi:hypothetical protein
MPHKRYIAFAWPDATERAGGWEDLVMANRQGNPCLGSFWGGHTLSFDTVEEAALAAVRAIPASGPNPGWHVVDLETHQIVADNRR